MNLQEHINQIITLYHIMIKTYSINSINSLSEDLSFEIGLISNANLKNYKNIENNYLPLLDKDYFYTVSLHKKIDMLINRLNEIENIILEQINLNNDRLYLIKKSIKKIRTWNNKKGLRKNNEILELESIIKEIFLHIFKILDSNNELLRVQLSSRYCRLIDNLSIYFIKNTHEIDNDIEFITNKLRTLEERNKKNQTLLESERLEKDKLIKELEFKNKQFQEQLEKENELTKINKAIDKLQVPCDELQKSQDKFRENRDNYDKYAMDMFKVATVIFVFMTFYLSFFTEINDVSKSVSIGYYLSHSFPILFPTIIGFLFIKQSNVNSKELDKINRRFILIHEVGQSLRALTEINDEKQMNEKTQKIIDKLIENILNYASENNGVMKNEESNILELNESIDKLIDTIDKKLTIIGKPE